MRFPRRSIGAGLTLLLLCAAPMCAAAQVTYIDDPLTASPTAGAAPGVYAGSSGGSFGPGGWTTTGDTDTVWWVIPASLPRGRLEVTATGLSIATNLIGEEHDLFGLYGPTDRAEPVSYNPWYRNNEFKILARIFGDLNRCSGCQAVGASKVELALCPALTPEGYVATTCPAACVAAGYDFWQAYLGPRGRDEPLPWDAATEYRFVINWEPGVITYSRGGPEGTSSLTFPGTYAPRELRVRIGPPSSERGPASAMPRGATFRDVFVSGEPGAATPSCDPGTAPPDAGVSPGCAEPMLSAVSLDPTAGRGASQIFRAVYRNCAGVTAFRNASIWVGSSVDVAAPHITAVYEGGRFYLDGRVESCAPGEARMFAGPGGTLDCARSTATVSGDDLSVDWALAFDTAALAGEQGVFVDAKGTATPEPRLGWTRMGTYTVESTLSGDGGLLPRDASVPSMDAGRLAPGAGLSDGCGCAVAGRGQPAAPLVVAGIFAALARLRSARRRAASQKDCSR